MSHDAFDRMRDYGDGQKANSSVRLPSLPQRLPIVERIMSEAIRDPFIAHYRKRSQFTFFCGADPEQLGGHDGQLEVVGRCLEWFVFDYLIDELGSTPAQHWFNLNADELSPQDRTDAADCLNFILGIFEITTVVPGKNFTASDLMRRGESYHISEHIVSEELTAGQLLLSRVFPHRSGYALSGMAVLMTKNATAEIKHLIRSDKLKPDYILPTLDGLELENMFGRSLKEIESTTTLDRLQQQLKHYVKEINPNHLTFEQLQKLINDSDEPVKLLGRIAQDLEIYCRHEMDLIFALILAVWNKIHRI